MSQQLAGPAMPLGPDRSEYFEALVTADASGEATADERAQLEAAPERWQAALEHLLDDTEEELGKLRRLPGPERSQVVADFEAERDRLAVALARLTGAPISPELEMAAEPPRLQASWAGGELVVWVGGPTGAPVGVDELRAWLAEAEAPSAGWVEHAGVPVPGSDRAPSLAAPLQSVLGWLAHVSAEEEASDLGASVRWVADLAIWAVELVAQGRMVPQLSYRTSNRGGSDKNGSQKTGSEKASPNEPVEASVQWVPALVDAKRLGALVDRLPGAVTALEGHPEPKAFTRSVLTAFVDAICRVGAERLEVPAPPPAPTSAADMAEAFLSRLRRHAVLPASKRVGVRAGQPPRPLGQAGHPGRPAVQLIVQLDPPDEGDAWHARRCWSTASTATRRLLDRALVTAPLDKRRQVETELARLERMLPALTRPGGQRRGEVVLSQDEAWELMSDLGRQLADAGFDVRVPELATRGPTPDPAPRGRLVDAVGRRRQPARQRPLVGAVRRRRARRGRDRAPGRRGPSAGAVARPVGRRRPRRPGRRGRGPGRAGQHDPAHRRRACCATPSASRATPLAGGLTIAGSSWAADLLRRAEEIKAEPLRRARGLRRRAAQLPGRGAGLARLPRRRRPRRLPRPRHGPGQDARRCWPTSWPTAETGATLVDRPAGRRRQLGGRGPALHPRPARSSCTTAPAGPASTTWPARSTGADVVLTTYGTAVRDIEALADLQWARSCSTRPRSSRTRPARPPSSCAASRPAAGWPSPARRSRTASATSGPSSTSPTPAWSGPGRRSSPTCRPTRGRRGGRHRARGEQRPAGPQRPAGVPPHQGRAGHRRRAARAHRPARPLLDDPRADRPLPGRARRARGHVRPG